MAITHLSPILAETDDKSIVIGFVTAVLTFIFSRVFYDRFETWQKVKRLKQVMVIECIGTLRRFEKLLPDELRNCPALGSVKDVRITDVRSLLSGFILSEPSTEPKQLIALLDVHDGRLILYFFDRWALFNAHAKDYSAKCDKLLAMFAGNTDPKQDVAKEYWDHICTALQHMRKAAEDLCAISCDVVKRFVENDDCSLRASSEGLWECWRDFEVMRKQFPNRYC